jgi:prophage DNA circulation protein
MVERTRLEGVSDIIREAHLESLDIVISDITLLNGVISAALSIPGVFASQIESISRQIEELIDTPDVLFAAMDGALTSIIASVNRVEDAGEDAFVRDVTSPGAQINAIASLITATAASGALGESAIDSTGTDVRSITAAIGDIERDNANVTLRGIRAAAICACAEAATEAVFPSHQEALDALAAIVSAIDALAEQPINTKECPDELYVSLQDLRARLSKGINAQELVDLVDFYPGEASDAAVIAYTLYGDATRAEEVAERAQASHPSFIPGATLIRVLEK